MRLQLPVSPDDRVQPTPTVDTRSPNHLHKIEYTNAHDNIFYG
jgi:hypothetical protein